MPNLLTVKLEKSNFTLVLPEFRFPKNSFHMLPKVLKSYFESLKIAFNLRYILLFKTIYWVEF